MSRHDTYGFCDGIDDEGYHQLTREEIFEDGAHVHRGHDSESVELGLAVRKLYDTRIYL